MNLIYKYMKFRDSYFSHFMLKASRYGEFNDPFDLVLGEYGMSLTEKDTKEFYEAMPEHYRTPEYYNETYLDIQAGARASVAILCFSEAFDSIPMWSHYADSHSGLCIGYDAECNFFNSMYSCNYSENVGVLKPVTYTKTRPQFLLPCDLVNNTGDWFVKSTDWSYEKEHRILLPIDKANILESSETPIWAYKIDPINIKRVIFGCRMKDEYKRHVKTVLNAYDIEFTEARPHPAYYQLSFQAYDSRDEINPVYNLGMDIK